MIILTMLGTGRYERTRYRWGELECETHLFPVALATWHSSAAVKALVTAEATDRYGSEFREAVPGVEFVSIPSGKSEDELWQLFNIVADALPAGETVILDITHGFRSLPTLTLLSLAFLQVAKNITLDRVVYGAYEARDDADISPVFDLTPFVSMLDWANATDRFLDTGDARQLAPLISERSRNPLNDVGRRMHSLSEALLFNRASLILNEARELQRKIASCRQEPWKAQYAPLQYLIDRVEGRTAPMAAASTLEAQLSQIDWLATHGHYPSAASLAREWLVSVRVAFTGGKVFPVAVEERASAEEWLSALVQRGDGAARIVPPEEWIPVVELWRDLTDVRNDLMHFGMRENPRKPNKIQEFITALPDRLRRSVYPLGINP